MRIAVIRLSSLGDIITTIVFVKLLKTRTNAHITWIVDAEFRTLLENCNYIDEICAVALRKSKRDLREIARIHSSLRALEKFDLVLDFQGLLKSAIIGKMLKSREFIGYSRNGARERAASIFYTKKVDIPYLEHVLKRQYAIIRAAFEAIDSSLNPDSNLKLPRDFDISILENRADILAPSISARQKIREMLKNHESCAKILFVLEAAKKEKEYGISNFFKLARELKKEFESKRCALKIFLIWHSNEREIKELGARDEVFCVLPHLNIDEIKALLGEIHLVIGGDTGITHLAWALQTPSITLFGNTPLVRVKLEGQKYISLCASQKIDTIKGDFSILKIKPESVAKSAISLLFNAKGEK